MIKYLLTRVGVVDIGGTYDPQALEDPPAQFAKIYKVVSPINSLIPVSNTYL